MTDNILGELESIAGESTYAQIGEVALAAKTEIERLRIEVRRHEDLWRLAYKVGPVLLTVRGSHSTHRAVTVDNMSYNFDDPVDAALLEARC